MTPTGGAGTKVGLSDPVVLWGNATAQRIKATLGITAYHSQEFTSTEWFWHLDVGSSHPGAVVGPGGLGCSPIKAVRELGSERRDSSSLSGVGVGYLREELALSTRETGMDGPLVDRLACQSHGRVAKSGRDKR